MRKPKRSVCPNAIAWLLGVMLLLCCTSASFAFEHILAIQYTLYSSDAFYKDGGDGEFFLDEDHTWDVDVVGNILLEGDSEYNYEIRNGSITLTPSVLLEDQSYTDPYNPWNPQMAQGIFEGGATLTITGNLTTVGGQQILASGILIQSTITSNFYAVEEAWNPDFLDAQMQCNVTGGEFSTGAQSGFLVGQSFINDITLRWCTQFGSSDGSLENFASDIGYAAPSVVQINSNTDYPIPEPASLLLFGLTTLLIKKRN